MVTAEFLIIVQPAGEHGLEAGGSIVGDACIIAHIYPAAETFRLEVIGPVGHVGAPGKLIVIVQRIISPGCQPLDGRPVQVHLGLGFLAVVTGWTVDVKGIRVVCLWVFAVGHYTTVVSCFRIIRQNTGDRILHVVTGRIGSVRIVETFSQGVSPGRPVSVEAEAHVEFLPDLGIKIEAGIVLAVVVVDLQALLILYPGRGKEVAGFGTTTGRQVVVLETTLAQDDVPHIGIRELHRIQHAHGQPLIDRAILEELIAGECIDRRPALLHRQCAGIVVHEILTTCRDHDGSIAGEIQAGLFLATTAAGGDQDDTVGRTGSVHGSGGRILEDGDRLDIVKVDAVDVHIGHTVHHNQWAGVVDRTQTADQQGGIIVTCHTGGLHRRQTRHHAGQG